MDQSLFYGTLAEIRQRTNSICLRANAGGRYACGRRRGSAIEDEFIRDWIGSMRAHLDTLELLLTQEKDE